jgi:transposase InsO family protein
VKELLGWTQKETASCFDVASNTIARWESESRAHPENETIGSLLKPQPPVRRFADVVRHLVQTMAASGFGGNERIAQTLARAGWKLAGESVRRIRKEKPVPPPEAATEPKRQLVVKARYPNHVTMADLTDVPSLFRLFTFKLAVVFDVFSRFPLAARVFPREPSGAQLADLFREALTTFGTPRHFVSDRGPQFTSECFRDAIQEHSVRHRFGALGKVGSIALIERLWRSAKSLLGCRLLPPLTQSELERRVELGLFYYAYLRPHQALGGATPAEVFFELPFAHRASVSPPRALPREGPARAPFRVGYLDRERFLPVLLPNEIAA